MHNKCNALESSPNHPHSGPWKNHFPQNQSLMPKGLVTAVLESSYWRTSFLCIHSSPNVVGMFGIVHFLVTIRLFAHTQFALVAPGRFNSEKVILSQSSETETLGSPVWLSTQRYSRSIQTRWTEKPNRPQIRAPNTHMGVWCSDTRVLTDWGGTRVTHILESSKVLVSDCAVLSNFFVPWFPSLWNCNKSAVSRLFYLRQLGFPFLIASHGSLCRAVFFEHNPSQGSVGGGGMTEAL